MKRLSRDKRCKGTFLFLIAIISFLGLAVLSISPVSDMPNVSAATELKSSHVATPCKNQEPTDQSLLVVMLDRSGSLIGPPGYATDPNLYSTSVTNALADLWPGKMAVIPFSGDVTQLPVFGPVTLSDPAQRADLKDKVNRYHIGGGTPTSTAMRQALTVLDNAPCGSRAIIITDGAPSGTPPGGIPGNKQIPDIENNLIPQFHQSGIPVSAFGLTISDSNAVTLLTDIAAQTGGEYQPVTDPKDLARAVISLYAKWRNLTFLPSKGQGNNYPVPVDSFAQKVTAVAFFGTGGQSDITLDGPDGHPVDLGEIQQFLDRHYVIDSLDTSTSNVVHGNYTLNTGNATDTQVYTLVQSSLQMRLDQPSLQVKSYDDEPVTIKGYFFDANQNARVKPGRNQAQVTALVSFFVNGKPTGQADRITLTQQGDTFVGQTQVYGQIGQLHIEVTGNDDGVQRETSITIPLLPPLVCLDGFLKCSIERHVDILIPVLVFLIILILALIWLFKQSPSGWLRCSRNPNIAIELGTNRGIMQRLLHKSTITSDEIANHPDARACFKFQTNTSFKLVFVKGGKVYLVPTNGNSATIIVKPPAGSKKPAITLKGNTGKAELLPGSTVNINGQDRFSFHLSKGG